MELCTLVRSHREGKCLLGMQVDELVGGLINFAQNRNIRRQLIVNPTVVLDGFYRSEPAVGVS